MQEILMLRHEDDLWTWIFDGALYVTGEDGRGIYRFYANGDFKKKKRSDSICLAGHSVEEAKSILERWFRLDDDAERDAPQDNRAE